MTIEEIIKKNEEAGHTFFHKEHMRWFRSRVHSKVYEGKGGIFFVTSEQERSYTGRLYIVREAMPSGGININGMRFGTSVVAHSVARRMSKIQMLYVHHIDGWTRVHGGEVLQKVLEAKKIPVRRCPRTGEYLVPDWVHMALDSYRENFAGMTEVEYLRKIAV